MRLRHVLTLLTALPLVPGLAACETHKGPAERAGASLDRSGENLRDTVDPPKGPAESLGRTIDRNMP